MFAYLPMAATTATARDPDVGGIIGNALRGDVPGIVGSASGDSRYRYGTDQFGRPWGSSPYGYGPGYRDTWSGGPYGYGLNDGHYHGYPGYRTYPSYGGGYSTGYWPQVQANPPINLPSVRAVVTNPPANGQTLNFAVNGQAHSVRPGESKELTVGGGSTIEFDRGSGQGAGRYQLSQGVYTFTPTERGWELYRSELNAGATAGANPANPVR
jgi:hypothetical protein